jgi:hypothetical protein
MELPAISWIALRRPAVLSKASRGASGNNRQNALHAVIVIVSHDFSVRQRLDSVVIAGSRPSANVWTSGLMCRKHEARDKHADG